jgi:hypothetical protein
MSADIAMSPMAADVARKRARDIGADVAGYADICATWAYL